MRSQCQAEKRRVCAHYRTHTGQIPPALDPVCLKSSFLGPATAQPGLWIGTTAIVHSFLWSICDPSPIHLPVATKPGTPWVKSTLGFFIGDNAGASGAPLRSTLESAVQTKTPPHLSSSPRVSHPLQLWFNYMYHIRAQARSTLMKMQGKKMLKH